MINYQEENPIIYDDASIRVEEYRKKVKELFKNIFLNIEEQYSSVERYLTPSSNIMNQYHEIALSLLKQARDCEDLGFWWTTDTREAITLFTGGDYDELYLINGEKELTPKTGFITNEELLSYAYQKAMSGLIRTLYSENSDDYFKVEGKKNLHDLFVIDESSYFGYIPEIIQTLEKIVDTQKSINKTSGFRSSADNSLSSLKLVLLNINDVLSQIEASLESRVGEINTSGNFDDSGWGEYYRGTSTIRGQFYNVTSSGILFIKQCIENMEQETNLLSESKEMIDMTSVDIRVLKNTLEDVNHDIRNMLADYESIQFTEVEGYMQQLVEKAKHNYLVSGEGDFSEVSGSSELKGTEEEQERVRQQAVVDTAFDVGLISSDIPRDLVTYENMLEYVDIGNYDEDVLLAYINRAKQFDKERLKLIESVLEKSIEKYPERVYESWQDEETQNLKYNEDKYMEVIRGVTMLRRFIDKGYQGNLVEISVGTFGKFYIEYKTGDVINLKTKKDGNFTLIGLAKEMPGLLNATENEWELEKMQEDLMILVKEYKEIFTFDVVEKLAEKGEKLTIKQVEEIIGYSLPVGATKKIINYFKNKAKQSEEINEATASIEDKKNSNILEEKVTEKQVSNFDYIQVIEGKVRGSDKITDGIDQYYPTIKTVQFQHAIQEAAIIAQGPGTPGFEEALDRAHATAVSNRGEDFLDPTGWKNQYAKDIQENATAYQEMAGMSMQEIAENYPRFAEALGEIDDELDIMPD